MAGGFRSLLAYWLGGASANASTTPPVGDVTSPTITILNPGGPIYVVAKPWYEIHGRSADNMYVVSSVTWVNHRGGSGTCTGVNPWYANIKLSKGTNILTFTATDAVGNTGTVSMTVVYTSGPVTATDGTTILLAPE